MVSSNRVYCYGVDYEGECEFLMTSLDKSGAKSYCEKHAKVFPYRFDHYTYGMPSQEREDWEIFNGSIT